MIDKEASSGSAHTNVGNGLAWALSGAYRLASRRAATVVGTDDALVSLARRTLALRMALDGKLAMLQDELGKQDRESPGRYLSGDGHRVGDLDLKADGALREARWSALGQSRTKSGPVAPSTPEWSEGLHAAVRQALVQAGRDGVAVASTAHLLDAVLADPDSNAVRLLAKCGIGPSTLSSAVRRATPDKADDAPRALAVEQLRSLNVLPSPSWSWLARISAAWYGRLAARRAGASGMLLVLEMEAVRQAVRLGHPLVTSAHLVLGVLSLHEEMTTAGLQLPTDLRRANGAGAILSSHGVTYRAALPYAALLPASGEIAPEMRRRAWRVDPNSPPWTAEAAEAAERTREKAAHDHIDAGGSHLLIAALAEPDSPARQLVNEMGADQSAIVQEAGRQIVA